MNHFIDGIFPPLTEKHILLLCAYKQERNKSQAQEAIDYCTGRVLSFGRDILPFTQQLIDWGCIERTNPNASFKKGHKHIITPKGEEALKQYLERYSKMLESISKWKPQSRFGF